MIRVSRLIPLTVLGFVLGCSDGSTVEPQANDRPQNFQLTDTSSAARGQLLEAKRIVSLSKAELEQRLAALAPLGIKPKNGVHVYKLVYQTEGIGTQPQALQASGIVVIPDTKAALYPWISVQHGTIGGKIQAPSVTPSEGIVEASQGFVAVVMDYLGYGSSSEVFRPYAIEKAYVNAGIDMLRASAQFAQKNAVNLGPLFLKGYSEGGYATMALQKALETTYKGQFPYPLLASAPSSGPYDLVLTGRKLLDRFEAQKDTFTVNPINVPLVILSYATWFGDGSYDLSFFFNDTPAVKKALNGAYDTSAVYALLPTVRDTMFKPQVAAQYLGKAEAGPEMQVFKSWLDEQSLHNKDWVPSTQTRLYHCKDDEEVPIEATESAYKAFIAKNPQAPVVPVEIPSPSPEAPYRHGTCPAIFAPIQWFGEILAKASAAQP